MCLPSAAVEALALEDDADIEIHVARARTFEVAKAPSKRDLLMRLRKYRGWMPRADECDVLDRLRDVCEISLLALEMQRWAIDIRRKLASPLRRKYRFSGYFQQLNPYCSVKTLATASGSRKFS